MGGSRRTAAHPAERQSAGRIGRCMRLVSADGFAATNEQEANVKSVRRLATSVVVACAAAFVAAEALPTVTFEKFSQGTPNGQFGWKSTGSDGLSCAGPSYDHMVAPNRTPFKSFGRQSLRISNAITSDCLRDQTFSAPVANEAGERMAFVDAPSGVRQPFFVFEFEFASMLPETEQENMAVVVSADKGDGGRLSWVEIADAADGLQVTFADYQDRPPYGSRSQPANGVEAQDKFVFTTVARGLDRSAKHRVRGEHYFYDGPHNDVVILKVDGDAFVHRGTSWEDYFRWAQGPGDPQETAPVRESRVARSILFRTGGAPAPNTLGFGLEFDNVMQASGQIPGTPPADEKECRHRQHHHRGHDVDDHNRRHHDQRDDHDGRGDRDDHDGRHDRDGDRGGDRKAS